MTRLLVDMVLFDHNRPPTRNSKSVSTMELIIKYYWNLDGRQTERE
jgi:hypothetical protein